MWQPPRWVSRVAQRPAMFWEGVSSQSTSFMASATLCRPPESEAVNRSSVSMRRSELPIQSAVGWCPAAIMTIRSRATSSSVKPEVLASMRLATSSPGSARRSASSWNTEVAMWRWPARASGPPLIMSFIAVTRAGPLSLSNPKSFASTRTGSIIAYEATRSVAPVVQNASISSSANASVCCLSAKGSSASSAPLITAERRLCRSPTV
ncbi:hypothetical protein GA0115247_132038 [Streptomyces sp. PalvLS-984]|nr:hypothetical protein GA0115247_132038 [Streptomyces sp. PalvLS-984]